ncbi:MAG: bifunctional oligoribonuclease/PAP phosphatase NrnA [Clostridiales bacterium]|nr:bifunctional oligoribonuclease/PAP phosphatase NrnA [Clostridiales bacterium]
MISLNEAAEFLKKSDHILILCHVFPDGDTLGSAAALCRGLQQTGRHAAVRCSDKIGPKYRYLFEGVAPETFEPEAVVAVDIADVSLFGEPLRALYGDRVDLCLDHHPSNSCYAKRCFVDPKAAATCEIIFRLLRLMEIPVDRQIAACLYTGITTDTGCFKYTNVTPFTYRIAADLVETGMDAPTINRKMFDTKSRAHVEMECRVWDTMEYFYSDRVAVIVITQRMIRETGAREDDLDGISALPRQVEGVLIGVTLREKPAGGYKISLRAQKPVNASEICAKFGGGGHAGAAGCTLAVSLEEAKEQILAGIGAYLNKHAAT